MQATSSRSSVAGWAVVAVLFATTTCVESDAAQSGDLTG
jgi:hypothetical protein